MRSFGSVVVVAVVAGVVVAACGGSQARPSGFIGACGVQMFNTPACQKAVDAKCCAVETECANDTGCAGLSQCMIGCKASRPGPDHENCVNGCALSARASYCESSCSGRTDDCKATCNKTGTPGEPYRKWGVVAGCSKGVPYPEKVRCDDES
ncbi:MAG: hypothetical protein JWP87_1556, partial [Labilithrix sp.]|nr:hypothetical protein [Labilithrix sp.]